MTVLMYWWVSHTYMIKNDETFRTAVIVAKLMKSTGNTICILINQLILDIGQSTKIETSWTMVTDND